MPVTQTISDAIKKKAVRAWEKNIKNSIGNSKTDIAKKFGISTRTLDRAIVKFSKLNVSVQPVLTPKKVKKEDRTNTILTAKQREAIRTEVVEEVAEEPTPVANYKFAGTTTSITISDGKESIIVPKDDDRFENVMKSIVAGDLHSAWGFANTKAKIEEFTSGAVSIKKGQVTIFGVRVNNKVTSRLISMMKEGADHEEIHKFCNFFVKLMDHHDKRVIDELLGFLEHMSIELCEDGTFHAYRAVRHDFKDKHSGKFDNSVGAVCRMPRTMVNDDKDQTCSTGLHFASLDYASRSYGGAGDKLIKVKIDPIDVVSIPTDYSNQKGRCCKFEVIEFVKDL